MHLIVTRTFPPEVGGMQNLMYGLAKSLAENVMISSKKVPFAAPFLSINKRNIIL